MKRLFLILVAFCLAASAMAVGVVKDSVQIGDIYYTLNSKNKTAEVVQNKSSKYTGEIIVPSSIQYNDTMYSVIRVGGEAFANCAVSSVTLPNTLTTIGYNAFYGCDNLQSMVIPSGVKIIPTQLFNHCRNLKSVTLPDHIISIEDYAFSNCKKLSSIHLPNSVTYIRKCAFSHSGLTSIDIPKNVEKIASDAFWACDNVKTIRVAASNLNYCSENDALFTKDKSQLIKYASGKGDTQYGIPDHVKCIAGSAFRGSDSLEAICIPESVTKIEQNAFQDCSRLTYITCYATTPPEVDKSAFKNVPLSEATLYVPINSIDAYKNSTGWMAFGKIRSLVPETVEVEDSNLWYSVDPANKTATATTNSLQLVISRACTFEEETIPATLIHKGVTYKVTEIEERTFVGCEKLKSVTIPNTVTTIGDFAFLGCKKLKSVTLPNSVKSIGDMAFSCCYDLESIRVPNSVTDIGDMAFVYCFNLKSVTLSDHITTIGRQTFFECNSLMSVTIPESVKIIGEGAFYGCGFESITIPRNVENIGTNAFKCCPNLRTVTCLATTPPEWNTGKYTVFSDTVMSLATLYVPATSVSQYKSAVGWRRFKNIKPIVNVNKSDYVDLGLPSGTWWKKQNEGGYLGQGAAEMDHGDELPTKEQINELRSKCQWTWTGSGYRVTGPNGNSITLPYSGYYNDCKPPLSTVMTLYWTSTRYGNEQAWCLGIGDDASHTVYVLPFARTCCVCVRLAHNF